MKKKLKIKYNNNLYRLPKYEIMDYSTIMDIYLFILSFFIVKPNYLENDKNQIL